MLLAAAALFVADGAAAADLRAMLRDARKHRSPNAGWPEAAMAGALGLALAGPRHYAAILFDDPLDRRGHGARDPGDIARALRVYSPPVAAERRLIVAWLAAHVRLPA